KKLSNFFGGDGEAEERSIAPAVADSAAPPVAVAPVVAAPAPMKARTAAPPARFSDDEAGLRALLLEQHADGLFGGEGELGATLAAVAALVSRGHTARAGSFRAELRRTVQALKSRLPSLSAEDLVLCALALAILQMPHGEPAPSELPPELAACLTGA